MCGFAGFTSHDRRYTAIIKKMAESISYRGPDDRDFYKDDYVSLCHNRLAITDTEGGKQPRIDEANGNVLVFNGEIYGYQTLAKNLYSEGIRFKDKSDTEVLFQMLSHYGVRKTLTIVDGMFSFAFYEKNKKRIYLARDRFGEKPLYYSTKNDHLVFASEIKAMLQHPEFKNPEPDFEAINQYLSFEYIPAPNTGIKDIKKLPQAHMAVFENSILTIEPYWFPEQQISETQTIGQSESEITEKLELMLKKSVKERLIADVPTGVFLSGGVDSSLVTAFAAKACPDITAYTVKMPETSYDETPHALKTAEHCKVNHEIIELTDKDVLNAIEAIGKNLDEPLADVSLIPTWLLCNNSSKKITVALGGDGADELFGGYPNHYVQKFAPFMNSFPEWFADYIEKIADKAPSGSSYMSLGFKLKQLSKGLGKPVHHQSFMWLSAFSETEKKLLWKPDILPKNNIFEPADRFVEKSPTENIVEELLLMMIMTYLPEDILHKTDRASMYNSMEIRSPFLGKEIAEYALSIPASVKIPGFQTKHLLKKLAMKHLPKDIVHRPKHGFTIDIAGLLKGSLYKEVSSTLLESRNDWFEKPFIEKLLNEHKAGKDHRKKLWSLYMLFKTFNNISG